MTNPFVDLSIVLFLATLISILTRLFKQPLIIGYIVTGLIVGPYFAGIIQDQEVFDMYSKLGISLLLFLVGLHLSPQVIKDLGKSAIAIGVAQVSVTFILGLLVSVLLGFGMVESSLIAIALTFSSTIIVLKTLADKNELESLPSKLSVGILLVQDLVAMILLIFLGSEGGSTAFHERIVSLLSNGLLLYGMLSLFVILMLPRISTFFAKSQEVLFLFSISYAIGLAALFSSLGFSIEIGSLIAGVTLTFFPYHHEIASKLRPLRDFFIILFFIMLGSQLKFGSSDGVVLTVIVLTIFVVIVKPIIVTILAIKFGYKHKTGINLGLTLGQVSEFSLILLAKNVTSGFIPESILSIVTLVALISIAVSSYEMIYSQKINNRIAKYFKKIKQSDRAMIIPLNFEFNAILFGYNRIGYDILKAFKELKLKYLIVDYDPEIIKKLTLERVRCQYGDLEDLDFIEDLPLKKLQLIVSTVPNFNANLNMLKLVRRVNRRVIVILLSHNVSESTELYKAGASYVIMPHFLGAKYAENMIKQNGIDQKRFLREKDKHIRYLEKRVQMGHQHPAIDKDYKMPVV